MFIVCRLQWQLGRYQSKTGWCIKVCGKNITRNVKLSSMGFVEADSPPYRNHNPKCKTELFNFIFFSKPQVKDNYVLNLFDMVKWELDLNVGSCPQLKKNPLVLKKVEDMLLHVNLRLDMLPNTLKFWNQRVIRWWEHNHKTLGSTINFRVGFGPFKLSS